MSRFLEQAVLRGVIDAIVESGLVANTAAPNPTCCSDPRHLCPKCQRARRRAPQTQNFGVAGELRILNQNPFDPTDIGDFVPRCAADLFDLDDQGRPDHQYIANRRRQMGSVD